MSSTLMWKLPGAGTAVKSDDDTLKLILRRRHGITSERDAITVTGGSSAYLEGLADAGVSGAAEVVALIQRHGTIELFEAS